MIITAVGEPIARIMPVRPQRQRLPDTEKDTIWVAEDFDAPLPDHLLAAFEGRG